jgi:integrase
LVKRTRYQYGSVEIDKRVNGPDVWLYRWWESTSDGRRTRRGFTVGTVEQYTTEAHALKAAEGMRLIINDGVEQRPPVPFSGLLDRFLLDQKQEQESEQITHNTLASYRSMISQHIRPKWGDCKLGDVRPTLVQDWLRKLAVSPKYKGHIRSLMYRLFDKAMLWELLDVQRNPMELVEVKGISKRRRRPCVLQVQDAWRILDKLVQPYRTMVLIALCFGLRISEILGLRWTDFDFKRSIVLIQRSAVGKHLNRLKTEYSQDEVPLEKSFIAVLKKWQQICAKTEQQWVFPSPATGRPYHGRAQAGTWQGWVPYVSPHLSGVARRNGSANGSTAEADATRAHLNHDGSVRQCFSSCEAKSQSANRATSPQKGNESAGVDSIIKGNCGPVPLIGQFWTVATNAKLPVTV